MSSPASHARSGTASPTVVSAARLRTSPIAPSSPCSVMKTTVRRKFGSRIVGEAISSWPLSDAPCAHCAHSGAIRRALSKSTLPVIHTSRRDRLVSVKTMLRSTPFSPVCCPRPRRRRARRGRRVRQRRRLHVAPPATTAAQPAAPGTDRLDASDNGTLPHPRPPRLLRRAQGDRRRAHRRDRHARVALPDRPRAQQPDGTTVEQAAVTLERKLRACGARKAAKRLAKLTG